MSSEDSRDITGLLEAWRGGDRDALAALMPRTYRRLKEIAARLLRGESREPILQTTALVHEAYLRLADLDRMEWRDRAHFYAMSARLMRRVLVDSARHRGRAKRGGEAVRLSIDELRATPRAKAPDLVALEDALQDLGRLDAERARIVELRFFGGLDREEIAEVMGLSPATVTRRWRSARAWLLHQLAGGAE